MRLLSSFTAACLAVSVLCTPHGLLEGREPNTPATTTSTLCSKVNVIVSAFSASSLATSWCSGYLGITTKTTTTTITPTSSTIKSTTITGPKVTQTSSTTTTLFSASTSTLYTTTSLDPTTITTSTVTNVLSTVTSSTLAGYTTVTVCFNEPSVKKKKRTVSSTPSPLKSYAAATLSAACSCLSLTTPTRTITSTASTVKQTVTSTSTVQSTTATTNVRTTTVATIAYTTSTVTTISTVQVIGTTTIISTTFTGTTATVTFESPAPTLDLSVFQIGVQDPQNRFNGDLAAALTGNGETIQRLFARASSSDEFSLDPTTGHLLVVTSGQALTGYIAASYPNTVLQYVYIIDQGLLGAFGMEPLVCSVPDACTGALSCTEGTKTLFGADNDGSIYIYQPGYPRTPITLNVVPVAGAS